MAFHSSSVGILLILTIFVTLPQFNNASSFLADTCGKAAKNDPSINHDFCVNSLQSDPRSASANLDGLIQITINLAIKNVTRTSSHINYLIIRSKPIDAHIKNDMDVCQDSYSSAKDNLYDAIKSLKAGRQEGMVSTADYITSAMTELDTCQDEISTPALDKQYADGFQLGAMVLCFLNKDHCLH